MNSKLKRNYQKFKQAPERKKRVLSFFYSFMPEILYRTTKLEGERVTRKMVKSLFK